VTLVSTFGGTDHLRFGHCTVFKFIGWDWNIWNTVKRGIPLSQGNIFWVNELKFWIPSSILSPMNEKQEKLRIKNVYNRLGMIMAHTNRYAFDPAPRLARDTGLSYTTIYNILHGYNSPTYWTAIRITEALEKATGKRLDPREIMDIKDKFPTECGCQYMGCKHCEYTNMNTTVVSTVEVPDRGKE